MRCATLGPIVMLINRKFDNLASLTNHIDVMLQPKYFSESIGLKSKLKFCHTVSLPRGGFVGLIPSKTKLLAPKRLSGDGSVATTSFSLVISLVTMVRF